MTIFLDFETRGFVDLPKVGVTRYATDKRTQALCMAWSYDKEERVRLWHRAHPWITKSPRPGNLIERIRSGEPVEAHNAGFEFAIWNTVLRREFPEFDVDLQLEQMHCSAAKGSCVSMPRALGDAADAAMLTNRKLKDGKRLIDKLSKPQFPRKKKKDKDWDIDDVVGPLWSWCEDEEDHRANWDYCKQDVRTEREFSEWLPDMTETERKYWLMDQRMNARGITLDADGARLAFRLARQETARLNNELCAITEGEVEKGTNRKALKTWINVHLEQLGAEPIADTKADTLSFALRGAPTKASDEVIERVKPIADKRWSEYGEGAEVVRRAMGISMEVNQTSVAKYTAMLESVSPDGRCHDIMLYNGASKTGRWSGKGIQPQNFVRGYKKEMTQVWDDMVSLPPEVTTILWDEPLKMLAKACRGALTASPGCELYAADFNAIEARKLAWLSNCQSQLALFISGGDPYIDMAQAIYKCELNKKDNPNERNLGKRAILGLGYCFAADTLVLTKRGWVRIDQVRLSDLLWDGCEWVSHKGLVCNGQKFVMSLGETFLTTDHPILCGDKFHPAREVSADVALYFQALATSVATLPLSGMSWRTIFDSRLDQSKIRGGQKENVYDLIDAGPRHRYTVLTRHGPMIVHNSMGWEKFQFTVWREEGIWLEDEFCQMIVDVYRKEKCPEVPKLWKASEAAAIAAVVEGGEHWAGGNDDGAGAVKYFMHKKFLHCQLPSGRYLAYLEPRVRTRVTWRFRATNVRGKPCHVMVPSKTNVATQRVRGEAERLAVIQCKTLTNDPPKNYVAPHLSFMGQNQITKQWTRLGTHGGSLVENYDQASSRDLLAEAMYRVDQDDRFALLLSIHDEVIAEGEKGCCTLEEFEELMAVVPAWAPGMPITAEGWLSGRLRK